MYPTNGAAPVAISDRASGLPTVPVEFGGNQQVRSRGGGGVKQMEYILVVSRFVGSIHEHQGVGRGHDIPSCRIEHRRIRLFAPHCPRWVLPYPAGPTSTSAGPGQSGHLSTQATASPFDGVIKKSSRPIAARCLRLSASCFARSRLTIRLTLFLQFQPSDGSMTSYSWHRK